MTSPPASSFRHFLVRSRVASERQPHAPPVALIGSHISTINISLDEKRYVAYCSSISQRLVLKNQGDAFMTKSYPDTLTLSRRVLRLLTKLNLLMGALILALLIASLIAESWVMRALGVRPAPGNSMLFVGMRLIMVIGICAVPITHVVLTRLLAIVDTRKVGNPFVIANAVPLQTIAGAILDLVI